MRICEKLIIGTKEFIPINLKDLKCNDRFRLFDDDEIVINQDGYSVWKAENDAYRNDEGIWQVDVIDALTEQ